MKLCVCTIFFHWPIVEDIIFIFKNKILKYFWRDTPNIAKSTWVAVYPRRGDVIYIPLRRFWINLRYGCLIAWLIGLWDEQNVRDIVIHKLSPEITVPIHALISSLHCNH